MRDDAGARRGLRAADGADGETRQRPHLLQSQTGSILPLRAATAQSAAVPGERAPVPHIFLDRPQTADPTPAFSSSARPAAADKRLHGSAFSAYAVSKRGEVDLTRLADGGGIGHRRHLVEGFPACSEGRTRRAACNAREDLYDKPFV